MSILSLATFSVAVFLAIFGGIILFHGRKEISTVFYAFHNIAVIIWAFSIYLMILPSTPLWLFEFATRLHFIGGQVGFITFFWFAIYYPARTIKLFYPLVLTAINFIVVAIILSPSLFVLPMQNLPVWSERVHITAFGFWIFTINLGILFFSATFLMLKSLFTATGIERDRIKYYLGSTFVAGVLGLTSSLILPFYGDFRIFPIVPIIVAILLPGIGSFILIRKYKFFDVKVVVTEIFVLSLWGLFLGQIFLMHRPEDRFGDILLFAVTVILGIMIIKSARKETEQREQLADLNFHLQEKVDEQTKEIRRAYDVEKKARIELEELDKSKTQFILSTEHHLRTPLTISKGFLDAFIIKKGQALDDEGKSYLDRVRESTARTMNLVNELLEVSQMGVGKSILKLELINIKDLVTNVITSSKADIDAKQLKTILSFPEDEKNNFLKVDKEKITEAVTNLISNVTKYNKLGGEIKVTGRVITKEEKGEAANNQQRFYQVTVEDQGIGIKPEDLPKILSHVFERSDEAKKLYATGRGIGLAVVKSVIEAHGGTVRAESDGEGKGARFIVELAI